LSAPPLLTTKQVYLLGLAVFAAAVLPYLGALGSDFLAFDDHEIILGQAFLRDGSVQGLWQCLSPFPYREEPLLLRDVTYWLNFRLHGAWAPGFVAVNLALHGACALALYGVARRAFRRTRLTPSAAEAAALASALIFATHPLHVESVDWISSRKDVLSLLFYLLTVRTWLDYLWAEGAKKRKNLYLACGGLYLLACLSKASVVSLPGILFVADVCLGPKRSWRDRLVALTPFAIWTLAFVKGYSSLLAAYDSRSGGDSVLEALPEGAPWYQTLICTDLMALGLYLRDSFLPWYPRVFMRPPYALGWSAEVASGLVVTTLGVGAAIWGARRSRVAGWLGAWFFMALVPFLNLLPTGIPYAPRYGFNSSAAASLLLGWGLVALCARLERPRRTRALGLCLALWCGVAAAEISSWSQAFRDPETLWLKVEAREPGRRHAAQGLGGIYARQARTADAAELEVLAERLEGLLETHNTLAALGMIRERQGRIEEALVLYKRTANIERGGSAVGFILTANTLVKLSAAEGFPTAGGARGPKWRQALKLYAHVAERWPIHSEDVQRRAAETLLAAGQLEEAEAAWRAYLLRHGGRQSTAGRAEAALAEIKRRLESAKDD
jgi:protein O-mannosyl-transferase